MEKPTEATEPAAYADLSTEERASVDLAAIATHVERAASALERIAAAEEARNKWFGEVGGWMRDVAPGVSTERGATVETKRSIRIALVED